jgi:hypothetical protein
LPCCQKFLPLSHLLLSLFHASTCTCTYVLIFPTSVNLCSRGGYICSYPAITAPHVGCHCITSRRRRKVRVEVVT